MKVHVTSVFLSVSGALVKSDLPVGWARDRQEPVSRGER
jgi:hypothetical protein